MYVVCGFVRCCMFFCEFICGDVYVDVFYYRERVLRGDELV